MTAAPFALCADDYGISPGVGRGIRTLIAGGRLSAASCMTATPHWPAEAASLRELAGEAEIGLHLTLTDDIPFGRIVALALARRLNGAHIAARIARQLDAFEAGMGAPPRFVDGHLHVHQLPVVRDALLSELDRRYAGARPWVRMCREPLGAIRRRGVAVVRATIVGALGGGLRRRLAEAHWPANARFAGVRNFVGEPPYRGLFRRFVAEAPPGLLVMCHPGEPDDALAVVDPVTAPRAEELAYLASGAFAEDIERMNVRLAPLSPAPPQ